MKQKLKLLFIIVTVITALFALAIYASAAEYRVGSGTDCDFTNVNAAFEAASDGDTIIITEDLDATNNALDFGKTITYILDGGVTWTAGARCSATGKDVSILARGGNGVFKPNNAMWCNSYALTVSDLSTTTWSFGSLDGSTLSVDLTNAYIRLTYGVSFKEINLLPHSEIINCNNTEVRDTCYFACRTFNMYEDSKIYGNYVQPYRGLISTTTLNIYGGEIYGNYNCEYGIALVSGTVNMYGGRVYNNYCSFSNSGVSEGLFQRSTLNMYGGEIFNNYVKGTSTGGHSVLSGTKYIVDGSVHDNYYFSSWTTPTKTTDVYSIPDLDISTGTEMGNGLGSTTVYDYSVIFKNQDGSLISAYLVKDGAIKSTVADATSVIVPVSDAWVSSRNGSCANNVTPVTTAGGTYYSTSHSLSSSASVSYPYGFAKAGSIGYACLTDNCKYINETESLPAIFEPIGYSHNSSKTAIDGGFKLNIDALDAYEKANGDISFGIIVLNPKYLGDSVFDSDYKLTATSGAILVEITGTEYSSFNFSVANFVTDNLKNLELVISAYAISDNGVEFIQMEYDLSETPATSAVIKSDASLYTITLNSIVNRNSLAYLPPYTPDSSKEYE